MKVFFLSLVGLLTTTVLFAQEAPKDSVQVYKKRVLESTEIDFLSSYYTQDGDNAATSGGIGTEDLQDVTVTFVVSIPLNDDDVLTIDAGISAYTSASSSNINPFDGPDPADPFVASSGESQSDTWANVTANYSHSSDDRNSIWSGKVSFSREYDYTSIGLGGSYTKLFNEKNTEVTIHGNVYLDTWSLIYPIELRPAGSGGGEDEEPFFLSNYNITGNPDYNPSFVPLDGKGRNSYTAGIGFSQILSKRMQGSLSLDFTMQDGLLSTPFHRIHFKDVEDSFIENFHLADDIERLPSSRLKTAIGGRLNYYVNEIATIRTFYRYYFDDWGIDSHTASIEVPIKILMGKFTFYPSYRYYSQTAVDYFNPYNDHLSTAEFYTSDYDLSEYNSNQFGFGISYNDVFNTVKLFTAELKSIDLKYYRYDRNTTFNSNMITLGIKLVP